MRDVDADGERGGVFHIGICDAENCVEGGAADPGLDAEPSAGDEARRRAGTLAPRSAERCAAVDGEGDSVARAGVGVEDHGDEDDGVGEEDGEDGLPPVHAAGDESGGEHVGGDAGGHGDPEGGDIPGSPLAAGAGDGGHVGGVVGGGGEVGVEFDDFGGGGGERFGGRHAVTSCMPLVPCGSCAKRGEYTPRSREAI